MMRHSASWRVDKSNDVHDLILCITGSAACEIDGHAMLVPAKSRFRGRRISDQQYTGIAQHFTLGRFGNVDLISPKDLRPAVRVAYSRTARPALSRYRARPFLAFRRVLAHVHFAGKLR
ncbi:hypothetical protein [Tropicimonas sp. IMCC34043]|uniref:hypothetical protein n=1 Tax=Tropicimonas sp. IMCC34043 TaxID=2248760 RepID=UPI000E22FE28|nr:hypothetical protein [Tropicimonas sp. IMCC34043]